MTNPFVGWSTAALLLSLRTGPVFALAPPFSQMQIPMRVKAAMTLTLSACLASTIRYETVAGIDVVSAAVWECLLGLAIAFAFQAAFAALSFAGRVLDVQAGYGIAMIIDPGSRSQAPMFGTILAMTAGVIFFAENGHRDLLGLLVALTQAFPPGAVSVVADPAVFASYFGTLTSVALGATGAVMLTLFLTDLAIAFLARVLPQMNALVLGFQVKTLVTLAAMAMSAGTLAPVVLRLTRLALDFVPQAFRSHG